MRSGFSPCWQLVVMIRPRLATSSIYCCPTNVYTRSYPKINITPLTYNDVARAPKIELLFPTAAHVDTSLQGATHSWSCTIGGPNNAYKCGCLHLKLEPDPSCRKSLHQPNCSMILLKKSGNRRLHQRSASIL